MRRLLVPLLALSLAPLAGTAGAGCDPETGQCQQVDCLAWDPQPPSWKDAVGYVTSGDPARAVTWVLPPVCPT